MFTKSCRYLFRHTIFLVLIVVSLLIYFSDGYKLSRYNYIYDCISTIIMKVK